jgi:hypothetical protein
MDFPLAPILYGGEIVNYCGRRAKVIDVVIDPQGWDDYITISMLSSGEVINTMSSMVEHVKEEDVPEDVPWKQDGF